MYSIAYGAELRVGHTSNQGLAVTETDCQEVEILWCSSFVVTAKGPVFEGDWEATYRYIFTKRLLSNH